MIHFKNIEYTYFPNTPFEKKALSVDQLSLDLSQYYGIVGSTGSGKSTFLKILTHLIAPSKGQLDIDPKPNNLRKFFGFVFQQPEHQLFCETVQEELEFSLGNFEVDPALWSVRILDALSLVGLDSSFVSKDPLLLSGGQKRRVAIASILAYQPEVLVLDEPTAGVDGRSKQILLKAFQDYHAQGHSIFLVSHDLKLINNECSKVLSFCDGHLVDFGETFEVLSSLKGEMNPGLSLLKKLHVLDPSISTKINAENFSILGDKYAS
ncbi:energy-coupling factor ABC transporter ATP-binding protein [bacterium]|nr:energy-coupling factor ABC transporter ATP-binding protein [bacterium]